VWKSVLQVFKFQVLKFKVCERKFFKLLRVSTLKFEKVWKRVLQIVESFNLQD
jgi:hypothetical protein